MLRNHPIQQCHWGTNYLNDQNYSNLEYNADDI